MKYYLFQDKAFKIDDFYFVELKKHEPSVQELTKQEYENYLGIGQQRQPGQKSANVGSTMAKNTTKQTGTSVQGDRTKKELIAELVKRGKDESELKRKNKSQLLELLQK